MVAVSVVDVVSIGGEAISGREGARLSVRRNECVLPGASSYRVTLVRSYSLTRGAAAHPPTSQAGDGKIWRLQLHLVVMRALVDVTQSFDYLIDLIEKMMRE